MRKEKVKLGHSINDPDIWCSKCKEVSGGSIEKMENEYVINTWCGCFHCTLEDYNKHNFTVNYEVEEDEQTESMESE